MLIYEKNKHMHTVVLTVQEPCLRGRPLALAPSSDDP